VSSPKVDLDSAAYWDGLRAHRVVVQQCQVCHRCWLPRTPACPYCGAPDPVDRESPGAGVVYSFVRAHRAMSPAMTGEVPYTIATVELDGGGRVFARVEGPCAIGDRVAPEFVEHERWTELRYRAVP
jgi:uncharacterized OB-fold protein